MTELQRLTTFSLSCSGIKAFLLCSFCCISSPSSTFNDPSKGKWKEAEPYCRQAMDIFQRNQRHIKVAKCLCGMGGNSPSSSPLNSIDLHRRDDARRRSKQSQTSLGRIEGNIRKRSRKG